jgi:hypothetical protein
MTDEQSRPLFSKPSPIPKEFGWDRLVKLDGDEPHDALNFLPMPEITEGSFELNLGILKMGAKLSEIDRRCAWELYTEIVTQVAVS